MQDPISEVENAAAVKPKASRRSRDKSTDGGDNAVAVSSKQGQESSALTSAPAK
jgi:hypothetical protein